MRRFKKEIDLYFTLHPEIQEQIVVVGIVMGSLPRQNRRFLKRRDELIYNFADWLKIGAVPPSTTFEAEMDATTIKMVKLKLDRVEWEVIEAISNDDLRDILGHSSNERDACMLAVVDLDGSEPVEARKLPAVVIPLPSHPRRREVFEQEERPFDAQAAADNATRALWGAA